MTWDLDTLKWLFAAVVAPLLGALGAQFGSWWGGRKAAKARLEFLQGMPPEAKSVLMAFEEQGAHTLRLDPMDPPVRLLIHLQVLLVGTGGGTYDAVDCYVSVAHKYREHLGRLRKLELGAQRASLR